VYASWPAAGLEAGRRDYANRRQWSEITGTDASENLHPFQRPRYYGFPERNPSDKAVLPQLEGVLHFCPSYLGGLEMDCVFRSLQDAEKTGQIGRFNRTLKGLSWDVGGPLVAALVCTWLVSQSGESWAKFSQLIFGDILKLFSLVVVSIHTFRAVGDVSARVGAANKRAISIYISNGVIILLVDAVLIAHIIFLGYSHPLAHNRITLFIVAALSSAYLFVFYYANKTFKNDNPGNWGIEKFSEAFMEGANLPFMVAIVCVGFLASLSPFYDLGPQTDAFLVGAVTFLIFSSTAANVLVDGYARPFLTVGSPNCGDKEIQVHNAVVPDTAPKS